MARSARGHYGVRLTAMRRLLFMLLLTATAAEAKASGPDLDAALRRVFDGAPARLRSVRVGESRVAIELELPSETPLDALPVEVENRLELAAGAIAALAPQISRI